MKFKILTKIIVSLFLSLLIFSGVNFEVRAVVDQAQTNEVDSSFELAPVVANTTVYFFSAEGCPHCKAEREFLHNLNLKDEFLEIKEYEITSDKEGARLLKAVANELGATISNVPFTVIGNQYLGGYLSAESSGLELVRLINLAKEKQLAGSYTDLVAEVKTGETSVSELPQDFVEKIDLPVFGKVNLKTISLPLLTFFIALLDGFNPCAMWALLFLISLLLGMENRRRMWILGGTFILASGFVYFLFMSAWLNLFLFLGFITWVQLVIGLVALATGGYYLQDFWKNKDGACSLEDNQKKQQTFAKLKAIALKKSLFLAMAGIIMLAFAVNLVELICSAGLPAIYTKVLTSSNLPVWQYYAYLIFYIFIFMLDDLVVFMIAMLTLRAVGLNSKYARFSHLIGGVLMFIIGVLMIFKPEWLTFG